jgi:hypothetical protein
VNDEIKGKLKAIAGAAGNDAAKALEDIKTLYSGLTEK